MKLLRVVLRIMVVLVVVRSDPVKSHLLLPLPLIDLTKSRTCKRPLRGQSEGEGCLADEQVEQCGQPGRGEAGARWPRRESRSAAPSSPLSTSQSGGSPEVKAFCVCNVCSVFTFAVFPWLLQLQFVCKHIFEFAIYFQYLYLQTLTSSLSLSCSLVDTSPSQSSQNTFNPK